MNEAPLDVGEDVNDAARIEWQVQTTPFERVRTDMKRTNEPQSAKARGES